MTLAGYRARKRLLAKASDVRHGISLLDPGTLDFAIAVLDEELERVAEQEFLRPMNPDPLKSIAAETKKAAPGRKAEGGMKESADGID